MSEMVVINLRLTKNLEKKVESMASKDYLSTGEFVRFSIMKLLAKLNLVSQFMLLDYLRTDVQNSMKKRHEVFSAEKELSELRKLREKLWRQEHEGSA